MGSSSSRQSHRLVVLTEFKMKIDNTKFENG